MGKFRRLFAFFLPLLLLTVLTGQAGAALQAVGPTDPITTLPSWYMDTATPGLPLEPCLDQNGFCLLPPPFDALTVPTAPITITGPINNANFPAEGFYYSAQSILPIEGGELANLAYVLEYAFLSGVTPTAGITFLRTDLQKMRNLTPNSTYRVTHPYGTFEFSTDGGGNTLNGGGAIRTEDGLGTAANYLPPLMKSAVSTNIGPFLTPADGVFFTATVNGATHTYIGDPANVIGVKVTGSPTGNNFFKIERLNASGVPVGAGATWQKDLFTLMGRVFTGQIPSPMSIDRVTYARDAVSAQIDVFATALPAAVLSISGTGLTSTPLSRDIPNTGKFFAHLPGTVLPSGVSITNSLDVPPIFYPVTIVDEIIITQAFFNPVTRDLTIKAVSRDKLSPPTLTVPAFAAPNTLDASGTLVKSIPANTIPPQNITVTSSYFGSATTPVSVVLPPLPPVAVNDSAITAKNSAVTINVLANDTADGGINPATVAVVTAPASGATAVANGNGTINYTPTATFTGSETLTYTFKDFYNQTSNTATVTVTVHAPPAAGNDAASAVISTTVNIDVIANDSAFLSSINSTTVNIVSAASCGSTSVLPNGTVSFTAPAAVPAGPGTCTFSYVVSDTYVPAAISNVANVTVTITPPPAPLAGNDIASTTTGTPVIVNVIANDTSAVSTINPATIAVNAPTGGTATANLNGTVTYSPPATPGSYSFTYTVKDNALPANTSNAATVTVSVTPAPPVPPATGAILATTLASPQIPGATVIFVGQGQGGSGTYQYQFWFNNGATWSLVQDYSSADTWSWNTTGLTTGTYAVQVNVRSTGSTVLPYEASKTLNYVLTVPNGPASSTVLAPSVASPQAIGTTVTFISSAQGGAGTYEYQYWLNNGTTWNMVRDYATSNLWNWNTSGLTAGTYAVQVNVRNVGSTVLPYEASKTLNYTLIAPNTPASSALLLSSLASPQLPGPTVTFVGSGQGGNSAYEYQYWFNDGTTWNMVQDYSTSNKWDWNTTGLAAGTYAVQLNVRNAGSSSLPYEAARNVIFVLGTPVPAATAANLTALPASPMPGGTTSVTFTGTGFGGSGSYEYQFWFNNGTSWILLQDYSAVDTAAWNPATVPAGTYQFQVNVRSAGSKVQPYEAAQVITYVK